MAGKQTGKQDTISGSRQHGRRQFLQVGFAGAAALAMKGCALTQLSSPKVRPNIILISLDSLRPDHLGCHGYFRDTSPNLDRFASEGVRFNNFFSVAGSTLPTHTSTFSGLEALTHGVIGFNKSNKKWPANAPNLLRSLGQNGYRRAAIGGEFAIASCPAWTRDGFDFLELDTGKKDGQATQGVVEKSLAWIRSTRKEKPNQPFFLYTYTGDIHTRGFFPDYQTAPEYMSLWTENPNPSLMGATPEERTKIIAQYDACIRYVDHWMSAFFQGIRDEGIEENTLIVLMSDHGDLLWDQGGAYFGHQFLYDSVLNSVLLMRWPSGLPSGKVLDCLANHANLSPTIADLAGIPPLQAADGESLVPVIRGKRAEIRDAIFANRTGPNQYTIRSHEWKYTRTENDPAKPNPFLQERAPEGHELYHLTNDPKEKNNVAKELPEKVEAMGRQLDEYIAASRAKAGRLGLDA